MPSSGTVPHLLHVFSTFAVGGPQTRFVTLANALGRRYRHTVLALDGNLACAERLDKALAFDARPLHLKKGGMVDLGNLFAIRRILAEAGPDLLLTYNWGAIEWALANRWRPVVRRHIHFEDGFGPDEGAQRQLPRRVLFRRLALGGRTTVVVPSRTLEGIATSVWRLASGRVRYIPNGVDLARFSAPPDPALETAVGPRPDELIIGTVGVLRPEKNLARLIRAFAGIGDSPPCRLVIVGGGVEAEKLRQLTETLRIEDRVCLLGPLDRPERVLGHFDIFALSSDTEQMPVSVLEAMAAGLPVAATDVGDVAAIVAPENCPLVVSAADDAPLAGALGTLLADATLRRRLGSANRARIRADFTLEAMVATYDALFGDEKDHAPQRVAAVPAGH